MRNFNKLEKLTKDELKQLPVESENLLNTERLFNDLRKLIADNGGPEKFFSSETHELTGKFENYLNELGNLAFQAIKNGDFIQVFDIGRQALEVSGVGAARKVSTESPNGVVALTEAINLAAKTISYGFYALKPIMIAAASEIDGVFFGYGEDGAYYLGSPTIGMASFHDPNDEAGYIITHCLNKNIPKWEYGWSGISRQENAFNILESISSGRELAKIYADSTSPEEIRTVRDKFMKDNFHNRLATLGDLLKSKK